MAATLMAGTAACTLTPSAALVPATGLAGRNNSPRVTEFILVEQSTDNPNHVSFQERVSKAVSARQTGWPYTEDVLRGPNRQLQPYGYQLVTNPTPPFSAYALYHGENLIQNDIARFWPVSMNRKADNMDPNFLLPIETVGGERLVISSIGVSPWPENSTDSTPPVYFGNQIAFAATNNGEASIYAGEMLLFSSPAQSEPNSFVSWNNPGTGVDHWAMELDNDILLDGQSMNKTYRYQKSFGLRIVNSQPLYFFTRDGLDYIHYAGRDLSIAYDRILYGNQGELAIFNPGAVDHLAWFYALRDGLWYYVEISIRE